MFNSTTRRIVSLSITAGAIVLLAMAVWIVKTQLGHASMLTGWTLLASVVLLVLLGVRKRFPMLPILPVRVWTQFHMYTGLFALAVYVMHVPVILASGFYEGSLSFLFLAVALSGLYGVWISRKGAKRLNAVPGEYRFDQFGWHRRKIADRAWDVLQELGDSADVPVLAKYYSDRLQHYFSGKPSLVYVMVPTSFRRRQLLAGLGDMDRYFSSNVKQASGRLAALVRTRDDLDFHYATQLRMRLWLAIHIAMTLAMIVFIVVHVLMVLRFRGG